MVDEKSKIETAINKTSHKMLDAITKEHRKFASEVTVHANGKGYRPTRMGSVTKQTQGPGSDIDIMCVIMKKGEMKIDVIKKEFMKELCVFHP